MTRNNPNLDIIKINAYTKSGEILSIVLKILSGNEILALIKGYNSCINVRKMTRNNPNQDLINLNAYTNFW